MIATLVLIATTLAQVSAPSPSPSTTATPPGPPTPDFVIFGTTTATRYLPFQVTFPHLFSDPRPSASVVSNGIVRNALLPTTDTQALIATMSGLNSVINEYYFPNCPRDRIYELRIWTSITGNGGGNIDCYVSPQTKAFSAAVMTIVNDLGLVKKSFPIGTDSSVRLKSVIPLAKPSSSPSAH